MKCNFKRFLSLLLVAMMLLCSMPLQAIAANVSSLPDATVEVLEPITLAEDEYMVWGGSLPAGTTEVPLQAVMKFTANDSLEEARAGKYADWICDFYLTFNGMETDSVSGVGSYLAGNYGEYGWIVIPTDSFNVEKGKEYPVVTNYDPKLTYENICDYVEEFTAAIYVNPETLLANPNMTVTLALKMTDPDDPDNTITIGKPAVYTAPELYGYSKPVAKVTVMDPITLISGNYKVWTGSLSTGKTDIPLQAMLNFEAVDSLEEAILGGYGDWICDFYLSFYNLEGGSVSGDGSYLAGAYGEEGAYANLGWIAIPTDELTVVEGEEYPVVTSYDPNLTYENICDYVRNFTAALYINPETLKANPNMTVTLKLKMTNRQDENDFFYIGEPAVYTASELIAREKIEAEVTVKDPFTLESGTYDVYTGSLNKGTTDRPLQAVVHFKALDSKEEAANSFFAKWICDFYLSFDGINDPNGIYGKDCYLAGAYGEEGAYANLGWITIPVDEVLVKEGEEYPVVTSFDPNLIYANICDYVREFTAAIYIAPEILIANPDFAVTLSLKVKDPANSDNVIVIGDPIVYTAEDLLAACNYVAINKNTNKLYDDVNLANTEAEKGETVALLTDVDVKTLFVYETLDLNGYTLKAKYVTSFGDIVDNSEDNGGLLKVSNKNFFIQSDNDQLPVNTEDGYKFVEVKNILGKYAVTASGDKKYGCMPIFEEFAHNLLLAGSNVSGVDIRVNVSWVNSKGENRSQDFSYTDIAFISKYINSYKPDKGLYSNMFSLMLNNVTTDLTYQCQVVSDTGVVFVSDSSFVEAPTETTTEENITLNANAGANMASALVPEGTVLTNSATSDSLKLTVSDLEDSKSNITLSENEVQKSVDVHIEGVSSNNTVPAIITLPEFAEKGLNEGNFKLYHVENGKTVAMTQVFTKDEVDKHNEFYYDPATGDVVLALATFSEITAVSNTENAWKGEFDYTWYTNAVMPTSDDAPDYTIANADQLAAFGAIVGGMDGQTQDSFAGKTVKLLADINLGDKESDNNTDLIFYPIGYNSSDGKYEKTGEELKEKGETLTTGFYNFCGTFDGNGHTISNFYQNTWEMKGDNNYYDATLQYYRDGMGLFGRVYGGTVKNLTVSNFSSDGEYTTTGVIAAYADGATFENISIFDCNPRVYNIGNGGIVGCVGWYAKEAGLTTTFENITVDNSNKISALWGSYDVACGGIVGQYYPTSGQSSAGSPVNGGIHFENCHVSAIMDVYNDVCANYQYYAYRYSGMLIGSVRENETIDGHVYPKMDGITAKDCTVHFGTWNDYYYCEFEKNGHPSYSGPDDYKFSRVPNNEIDTSNGKENATCIGHNHSDVEDNRAVYLPFENLVTGYGWGVTTKAVGDLAGVTILDREVGNSVEKFTKADALEDSYTNGESVTIGELFKAIENAEVGIINANVMVSVSPIGEGSTAGGTYVANTTDWTKGTLTFSGTGAATITITDYYFCTPTTITVTITDRQPAEKFDIVMNNGDFLHRVGNSGTVALDKLFKAKEDVTVGTISVTVEAVDSTGASGTYANNEIQFSGTGVVKVTITDNDYCTPTVLYLEVVDATNCTNQSGSNGTDIVLLQNIKVNTNGTINYKNCTVYGNGFEIDVRGGMNQYNSKQGHGIIIINNATLDNLRIVGDVYDEYGMYTVDLYGNAMNDYTAAVDATNSIIQNCYIANCSAPIRSNGNTITDTTLYGGTVANLLISGGTNTLTNVTTVNYNDGRGVIGMGIVITDGASADSTKLELNGYLKQYNYVYDSDISEITVDEAKTVFESMFTDKFSNYHIGSNPKAVNTGIISINEEISLDKILEDKANTGYVQSEQEITFNAQGVPKKVTASVASVPSTGTIDNNYVYAANAQGDYLPTFNFDLGDQSLSKDNDDDTRYLIGDKNGLTAMYTKGESAITLDLTKLATVSKYTDTSYPVTAKCVGPNGNEQTGTVTLNEKGTYTLVFTVEDNLFYNNDGSMENKSVSRTYEVPLVLDIYEKSIADATMTISSSNLTGEYISSGTNKKYKMYPLEAITKIMDDANKDGVLENFNFKTNIQSAVLTPEGNNAFSSPTTITVTYTGGQVLTIVLGTPSGLNSPGASNGGKTFSVKEDSTNGIYLQSDGAIASGSAATGTWPITSWSFKGTSGKVITDNTNVTINFTKPSGGCLAEGTLITLADGSQKPIEQITYNDQLLAWDFNTGAYAATVPSLIEAHEAGEYRVINLNFADGTTTKVIVDHGFFDVEANNFVVINENNVESFVGHKFLKLAEGGTYESVELIGYEVTVETVSYYSIQTAMYNNSIADGMFTLPAQPEILDNDGWFDYFEIGDDMKYDEEKMQADIAKYGLYDYSAFADYVTYEQFIAFNGPYLKVLVGRGVVTFEQILELIAIYVN